MAGFWLPVSAPMDFSTEHKCGIILMYESILFPVSIPTGNAFCVLSVYTIEFEIGNYYMCYLTIILQYLLCEHAQEFCKILRYIISCAWFSHFTHTLRSFFFLKRVSLIHHFISLFVCDNKHYFFLNI